MPIMAAQGQNDARGTARLLAIAARDCVSNPTVATEQTVVLNNVYRLLEAYRRNVLPEADSPARRLPPTATEVLSLLPAAERHVSDVRAALDGAVAVAFGDRPSEQAINVIEEVLRGVAYPKAHKYPSADNRAAATKFFEELLRRLGLE